MPRKPAKPSTSGRSARPTHTISDCRFARCSIIASSSSKMALNSAAGSQCVSGSSYTRTGHEASIRGAPSSRSTAGPPACTTSIVEKRSCPLGFGVSFAIRSNDSAPASPHWWYLTDVPEICTPGRAWYREVAGVVGSQGEHCVPSFAPMLLPGTGRRQVCNSLCGRRGHARVRILCRAIPGEYFTSQRRRDAVAALKSRGAIMR
eukprot:scaffold2244_cov91-Isochrysis_galbana.AAC.1